MAEPSGLIASHPGPGCGILSHGRGSFTEVGRFRFLDSINGWTPLLPTPATHRHFWKLPAQSRFVAYPPFLSPILTKWVSKDRFMLEVLAKDRISFDLGANPNSAMRTTTLSVAILGTSCFCSELSGTEAPSTLMVELRKERIEVLEELVGQLAQAYEQGRVNAERVIRTEIRLTEARIEAAEKREDELALRRGLVKRLKRFEELAKLRVASGLATRTEALEARESRLAAELELAKTLRHIEP